MIVARIDPESRSTIAASEGLHALGRGDTVLARQKLTEAGKILEAGAAQTASRPEKNLLRFLAASQYYHGGDYQRAKRIVQRTRPKYLSEYDQEKFEQFRKDVEERADAGYAKRIREAVVLCWVNRKADEAIRLLQDHPYVLERSALAWLRADLCYMSGRWRAAALFYADTVRLTRFHPTAVFLRAAGAMRLYATDHLEETREYTDCLLANEPTALDFITGCVIKFTELVGGDPSAASELLHLFDRAVTAFEQLPAATQADADVRAFMAHGYSLAAIASNRLGDRQRALRFIEAGLEFTPTGPEAEGFRAVLANPREWLDRPVDQFHTFPSELLKRYDDRNSSSPAALGIVM